MNIKLGEQLFLRTILFIFNLFSKNGLNFWWLAILSVYKMSKFPLSMLIFVQKSINFYIPHLKTPQQNLPYSANCSTESSKQKPIAVSHIWRLVSSRFWVMISYKRVGSIWKLFHLHLSYQWINSDQNSKEIDEKKKHHRTYHQKNF